MISGILFGLMVIGIVELHRRVLDSVGRKPAPKPTAPSEQAREALDKLKAAYREGDLDLESAGYTEPHMIEEPQSDPVNAEWAERLKKLKVNGIVLKEDLNDE